MANGTQNTHRSSLPVAPRGLREKVKRFIWDKNKIQPVFQGLCPVLIHCLFPTPKVWHHGSTIPYPKPLGQRCFRIQRVGIQEFKKSETVSMFDIV